MEPRLRRWKSGNIQLEKCVCGKTKGGPADGRSNLRLWNVFWLMAAARAIDCPKNGALTWILDR